MLGRLRAAPEADPPPGEPYVAPARERPYTEELGADLARPGDRFTEDGAAVQVADVLAESGAQAETVDCRGRVVGAIVAAQVRLYGAAHVEGEDVAHFSDDQLADWADLAASDAQHICATARMASSSPTIGSVGITYLRSEKSPEPGKSSGRRRVF